MSLSAVLKDKKTSFLFVLFVVVAAISWHLYFKEYLQKDTVDINQFPKTIGEWTSEEIPITETEFAILETKNAFVRKYTNPKGDVISLFIVYSQHNRKVAHPPEICYTGGGFSVISSSHDRVPLRVGQSLEVNKLNLAVGALKQAAFYWFKIGDSFTTNYWKQQVLIATKTILGQKAGSALIRVSIDINPKSENTTIERLKDFTRLIYPAILQFLP